MSQYDFGDLESPLSGTALINTHLEPWRDAVHSTHAGSSRPSYAVANMIWTDISTTPWVLYMFDGSDDISIGTINPSTNVFTPSGVTSYGGSAGGTANALTLTPTTALTAYADGVAYEFLVTATNTTAAPTLNVSSLGAKTIKCSVGGGKVNLPIGALQNGMIARAVYDGTDFLLLNVRANNKSSSIATASTVNLDNANGDYVTLTGTTTVTAFTLAEGCEKTVLCDQSFEITDGSGNSPQDIICPGGATITTAAGDVFVIRGEASGTARIISYTPASDPANPNRVNALGNVSGATTIDLDDGRSVSATMTGNATFTFSNPKVTGFEDIFTLRLTNGSYTPTWPASVDWAGGTAPTPTNSGTDEYTFKTIDGGTIWSGVSLLDVS